MGDFTNQNYDLKRLSRYKALRITRYYILCILLLCHLYSGYYGLTLVPFYLLVLLAILPSALQIAISDIKEIPFILNYTARNLNYTTAKDRMLHLTFLIIELLLFLWAISCFFSGKGPLWLTIFPTILIISSLLIYTIGQYYYFRKYHRLMLNHELDAIH